MNRIISKAGAAIVTAAVFLFAVFIITGTSFMQYLVCMFLPIGFIMMTAGLHNECDADRKTAADIGMAFSAVYTVLILLVYFAQDTTVRLEALSDQAASILDYRRGGLLFNYDLLGYGMMALSTFFTGLSLKADNKADKWLKGLMIVHGVFFLSCFFMPMTGMFIGMGGGEMSVGGAAALLIWCVYFLPIGILAYRHFGKADNK